ncbi:MAG: hypothetical protein WDA18_03170 [Candidatus Ratteibacteria bacterium]|jgi:hypothetical protein
MKRVREGLLVGIFLSIAVIAAGQSVSREPSIGYLYPAGGERGSSFLMVAGGQNLRGASQIDVTGEGVSAVSLHYGPLLNGKQRQELQRRLKEIRTARSAEQRAKQGKSTSDTTTAETGIKIPSEEKLAELPDHPFLRNLETRSPAELRFISEFFLSFNPKQPVKRSIQELVFIEIAISSDAILGNRDLRLQTPAGLSNPLTFQVGAIPERYERIPDTFFEEPLPVCDLPVLFNGQISPGDIDRFQFRAKKDDKLVIVAEARSLIPYLPDAVPGWIQAVIALYDEKGKELAYADDWRGNPDPVLFFHIPNDGLYTIEIRDALFRGREDFVYRLTVGEIPFITHLFPLTGRTDTSTRATISGWNLPSQTLLLDTSASEEPIRSISVVRDEIPSNTMLYRVENLRTITESEPNDSLAQAIRTDHPILINGKISLPGDKDTFLVECQAETVYRAEIYARRLGSPLDALLKIIDKSGNVITWNDDYEDKSSGLITHHADSFLLFTPPQNSHYFIEVSDSQHHGGDSYAYTLFFGPATPDFDLRIVPSTINALPGTVVPMTIQALRKNGFSGKIALSLKEPSLGFTLGAGALIPAGKNSVRTTLTVPQNLIGSSATLSLEGDADTIAGKIRRPVIPAEDMMQAFDYRHLVPKQSFVISTLKRRPRMPAPTITDSLPIQIPPGGSQRVRAAIPAKSKITALSLMVHEPMKGISVSSPIIENNELTFLIHADPSLPSGFRDTLILEAFEIRDSSSQESQRKRARISLGFLPAISFLVMDQ